MRRFAPVSADSLPDRLSEYLVGRHPVEHPLRVGFDAPGCCDIGALAATAGSSLTTLGHPTAVVGADTFYRDASLRYEYGKQDVESFYSGWLDVAAVQREVLRPLGPGGDRHYLPSLRDPVTNRSTREPARRLPRNGVLILHGSLLLGAGLELDVAVHFNVSRQARRRLTAADHAWTLPAYDRYDIDVDPSGVADLVVRYDDPRHPAVSGPGW